ncbi:MAG TPA: hypothetical protein VFB01_12455, partial [Burkholderiales bacterium]|nr:hypothetical protein [Burkholderiales bacterium]
MVIAPREARCQVCGRDEAAHAALIHPFLPGAPPREKPLPVMRIAERRRVCDECGSPTTHRRTCSRAQLCDECGS